VARAVTADHVLFREGMDAFRRDPRVPGRRVIECESNSFLLSNFEIPEEWNFEFFSLSPTIRIQLPGFQSAFISHVKNPTWVGRFNWHLFSIALSAIFSFGSGKLFKAPRDEDLCRKKNLSSDDLNELAILNPILTAGPGCVLPNLSHERRNIIKEQIGKIAEMLLAVDYDCYETAMQSMRLVHLSLANKRDDFGLAYLLIVAAIEAVAQKAITRDKVKRRPEQEKRWEELAKNDPDIDQLFKEYKACRGNEKYLKERYVRFIEEFAPVEVWEKIVPHRLQDIAELIGEKRSTTDTDFITRRQWFEKYPSDLSSGEIRQILESSYAHRSDYIHMGKQPPHKEPFSYNRFFQGDIEIKDFGPPQTLLPNYDLLTSIARFSIQKWLAVKGKFDSSFYPRTI
jgi:hypothetical protein